MCKSPTTNRGPLEPRHACTFLFVYQILLLARYGFLRKNPAVGISTEKTIHTIMSATRSETLRFRSQKMKERTPTVRLALFQVLSTIWRTYSLTADYIRTAPQMR